MPLSAGCDTAGCVIEAGNSACQTQICIEPSSIVATIPAGFYIWDGSELTRDSTGGEDSETDPELQMAITERTLSMAPSAADELAIDLILQ